MQATKCCTNFSSHMAKSERGLRDVPAPSSSVVCRVGGIKRVPPTHLFPGARVGAPAFSMGAGFTTRAAPTFSTTA